MRIGRIIFGILAAMGVGTILGILFAPDKGSETRKKISNKTRDLSDEINAKVNEAVHTVNKKMENLKEETGRMAASMQKRTEEVLTDFDSREKAKMN
jgi:gas vesicle protein